MSKGLSRRDFVKASMVVSGAALLSGSFLAPFVRKSYGKEEIKIGYLKATHHAAMFNSMEEGYYKEEGLDVKPVLFSTSGEIGTALITGAIQVGYIGSSPSIGMITRGVPMNIVSGSAMESSAVSTPYGRPTDIKSVKDLRGKRIGTIRAASADIAVRYKMIEAGIDPFKEATVRNFSHIQDIFIGLEKGELDAAILWEPWATYAEFKKYGTPAFFSKDIWPRHVCCRMTYNEDWASKSDNMDAAVKVMKSHIRGHIFAAQNFKGNVKNNAKWCGIEEEQVNIVFAEKRQRLNLDIDPAGSQKYVHAMKVLGIVEKEEFQKNGLNPRFQELALKELGLKSLPKEI